MDKNELQILSNVLNDEYGFKLVFILLKKLGAFERGVNHQASDREVFINIGRREKGQWLLDSVFRANKNKYIELLEEKEKDNV